MIEDSLSQLFSLSAPVVLLLTLAVDAWIGDPEHLYRRVPHPAVLIGRVIAWADLKLNRESDAPGRRRHMGKMFIAVLAVGAFLLGWAIQALLLALPLGWLWLALVMSTLLAQNSLYRHVADVAQALRLSGIDGGRIAVARIVGRDPNHLDEAGVSRAAIESLAENFADAVVAPAFWGALFGLPGLLCYKAINTADSMIGHKSSRYLDFGRAAARLDDLVNLPASRLAGVLLAAGALTQPGANAANAIKAMRRDARHHRSPNAGWPEAAMAGALGFALNGPRIYGGVPVNDGWMNDGGRSTLGSPDIWDALRLYLRACGLGALLIAVLAFIAH
jgi:adenosylcobinamide-phosphate synthase